MSKRSADYDQRHAEAQAQKTYTMGGTEYTRIPYGQERQDWDASHRRCHDCDVQAGELHLPGCDVEECPKCGWQAISCDCDDDDEEVSES